jgi:KGK domain
MNNQTKQIIPDPQAVIQCLDSETLEILSSHSTFTVNELLGILSKTKDSLISREKMDAVFIELQNNKDYTSGKFFYALKNALCKDLSTSRVANVLVKGTTCNLLQPDGKGWQKGQIKICFEFIPEEDEPIVTSEKQVEADRSPLDDIRASLIESN